MLLETAIHVSKYKCFGDEPQGFSQIKPINLIIGKNNSGKSALIDIIEHTIYPEKRSIETHSGTRVEITQGITQNFVDRIIDDYAEKQGSTPAQWKTSIQQIAFDPHTPKEFSFFYSDQRLPQLPGSINLGQYQESLQGSLKKMLNYYTFRRLNAERDILPEITSNDEILSANGKGSLNLVRRILTLRNQDINLVRKVLLNALNEVIQPDMHFTDIAIRSNADENLQGALWEIYLEADHNWIQLSKMGSGVKTIILCLINLLIIPKLEKRPNSEYIFALEELENNLHPALQRRLFNYIHQYCEAHQSIFFITTHSNIAIDLFLKSEMAQIIHVQKKGAYSTCTAIKEMKEGKNILKDLDYKASDLLLSNGIIWVEGPSDAIYLELLLDLLRKENPEIDKMNFTIQALSTAIWKYAGFNEMSWDRLDTQMENKLISLARINHNHLIILDKDTDYENKKPSEYQAFAHGTGRNKARLINESMDHGNYSEENLVSNDGDLSDGSLAFWINEGTMETYLHYFITNKGITFEKYFNQSSKGYFEKKRSGDDHSISKVELAAQIASYCENHQLQLIDIAPAGSALSNKLTRLLRTIRQWNK